MGDSDALARLADLENKIGAAKARQVEAKVLEAAARQRRDEVLQTMWDEFQVRGEGEAALKVEALQSELASWVDVTEEALRRSVG